MGENWGGRGDGRSVNMTIRQSFVVRSMRTILILSDTPTPFSPEQLLESPYLQVPASRRIGVALSSSCTLVNDSTTPIRTSNFGCKVVVITFWRL
mgnify:CR=1 FL=1